ncbi:MAG: sensor histidine kinase [Sphingobacteriales bacterium]|jgi:two-component system phosphate regulon sensor histidine kinase PhoR|nr:sensor histidine kinase [Sphingobacteriales bacterium]
MFDAKNLSSRRLSIYTAIALAIPVGLIFYIAEGRKWLALGIFVTVLLMAYFLFLFVLERFIYRKIKPIYKLIYKTKATKKEETYYKYILPAKSISEVAEDVEAWAEENRLEMELLKANEQYRREFLQNLSHEFKTPVFSILSYVETLLNTQNDDPEIRKRFLEKTSKNVQRLAGMLNDLDEISKLERGELKLKKSNFVIQELLRECQESIAIKTEPLRVKTGIKKGCEAPIAVNADKEKIRQVLLNLFENAIKYGRKNGSIKVGVYATDDKRILVEISDDGIGISSKSLPRIFERFYRTESGRNVEASGSGLGLAICKHIIEAHRQTIHIRSTENVGTTIGFTLDAKKDG